MHVMGVRKDVAEAHPWLPGSVYKAFCEAKAIATKELVKVGSVAVTVPWPEVDAQAIKLMGKDFWRYGVAENAHEIETLARYAYEQGLTARLATAEDLFHPYTFERSRI